MISASRLNASSHDCRSAWVKSGGTARSRRWVQQRQHRCAVDRAAECAVQQGVHREVVQRPELHDVRAAGPPQVHQRRRCTREVGHGGLQCRPAALEERSEQGERRVIEQVRVLQRHHEVRVRVVPAEGGPHLGEQRNRVGGRHLRQHVGQGAPPG